MADLQQMSRVLYHHDWARIEDWARNVDQLADLSDDEIGQLECCDGNCPKISSTPSVGNDAASASLFERTWQGLASLCESLRFGLRRTC